MNNPTLRQLNFMLNDTMKFKEIAIIRNYDIDMNIINNDIKDLQKRINIFEE